MASFTPPRTRTLELETSALSHAVALAGWIPLAAFQASSSDSHFLNPFGFFNDGLPRKRPSGPIASIAQIMLASPPGKTSQLEPINAKRSKPNRSNHSRLCNLP
jgi:hypothetical protein